MPCRALAILACTSMSCRHSSRHLAALWCKTTKQVAAGAQTKAAFTFQSNWMHTHSRAANKEWSHSPADVQIMVSILLLQGRMQQQALCVCPGFSFFQSYESTKLSCAIASSSGDHRCACCTMTQCIHCVSALQQLLDMFCCYAVCLCSCKLLPQSSEGHIMICT